MPTTFSQSLRALSMDRPRASLAWAAVGAVALAAWGAWFAAARVVVLATTEAARVEAAPEARGGARAVGDFAAAEAIGRVRPGQRGRLRLSGFPWATYGAVEAKVTAVGEEREGRVRVELSVEPTGRVRLERGMPGSLEIEVEEATPLGLVLRAAGGSLGRRTAGGGAGP